MPCTPQKPEGAAARTTQLAQKLENTLKTQKNRMLALFHSFPSRVLWKEMKKYRRKRLGKPLGKNQVEYHFVGCHKEENYSKGMGVPCTSSKTRGGSCQNHPSRPEAGKNVKNPEKPNACLFPLIPIKGSLCGNERNIGEKGWENHWERATLNAISWDFPRRNIILGVLEMPCTPQKPEGATARTTQVAQKLEKTSKTYKNRTLALSHYFSPHWEFLGVK